MKKFYKEINSKFAEEFNKLVKDSKSIVITTHISPDDDAISSTLAMHAHLTKHLKVSGKDIKMIITGKPNHRWDYFDNYKLVKYVDDLADNLNQVDLLIMLDGSGWYRFSKKDEIKDYKGKTICIDHHPNPENKHDLHLLLTKYVACAEIIYKLFFEDRKIDKDTLEILFLGVWGDTGGLRFVRPNNTSAFDVIKRFVDEGNIDIQTLQSNYQKVTFKTFKLISFLMDKTEIMEVKGWPLFQVSYLSRRIVSGYAESELVNAYHLYIDQYVRMIEGADWGFVVVPKGDGTCGLSFRSLPKSVNVRKIAENIGGGGHDRAAGGRIKEANPLKAIDQMIDVLKKNKPIIT